MTTNFPNLSPIKSFAAGTLLLLLAACTMPITSTGSFCAIANPITWSSKDDTVTIAEIKKHNAVGVALCGWKGR